MKQAGAITMRLYELLCSRAAMRTIADIRIGSTYIAVCLDDGCLGLSAVPIGNVPLRIEAISLVGACASSILAWLNDKGDPQHKAVALATANALIRQERSDAGGDALDLIKLTSTDRVLMVGRFSPMIERITATGASLIILEKDAAKGLVLMGRERRDILQSATVCLITATALLYDSLEEILNDLCVPRHVTVMGPSTPMLAELFADTPVHHLGGVRMIDADKIPPIVAAGGGTRAMRPYVEMTNLFIKRDSVDARVK